MVEKEPPFITLPAPHNVNKHQFYHPQFHSSASTSASTSVSSAPSPHISTMYHPQQMSAPQSPPMHQGAGGLQPYPPPPNNEGPQSPQASNQYPQYSYDIQLKYPQNQQHQDGHNPNHHYSPPPGSHGLPLPPMTSNLPPLNQQGYPPPQQQQEMPADTSGQIAPPGSKPRVTATLWEDEGTLCFQVDVKGTCVARREDNHMINGTKLLNVAGMTRGRRDGILKAEKQKHVVKIGPMHLKGVWIPFEKALEFANKEKITEMLYPLFVHNIGALLYHPSNQVPGGIATRASRVYAPGSLRRESVHQQQQHQQGPPPQQMENMRRESIGMSPQDGYKHEPRPYDHEAYKQEPPRTYEQEPRGYEQEPRGYEHERATYDQDRSPQSAHSEQRMINDQLHQQQQQQQRAVYDHFPVA
ncbi:hypothetical protein HYALB_00000332 [Hymenoscyphus albidus]|uniref:HTH APSES-type domain-containing protein n=1 Tax=Hymenoscyphus albidus TaxID=595503 RepID=A0A9N9LV79_9HELO|nr:hypothetical protein HYALB_00000332 [Hymenoscyphus albidus]